ncbi:hypothetical protein F5Y10DRAFT_271291 [Nemania abortiva]|nr:hypothetical protein F5Y10DRAFT_271291 [Nemania abortiva]
MFGFGVPQYRYFIQVDDCVLERAMQGDAFVNFVDGFWEPLAVTLGSGDDDYSCGCGLASPVVIPRLLTRDPHSLTMAEYYGPGAADGAIKFGTANTNDRNEVLWEQEDVKKIYKVLGKATRPTKELFIWLGNELRTMSNSAIPLFTEKGTGYQIHPKSHKWPLYYVGDEQHHPHPFLYMFYDPSNPKRAVFAIQLGSLFINKRNGEGRLSRWTGFEVLLDIDLNLWFLSSPESLKNCHTDWAPVRCRLFQDWPAKDRNPDYLQALPFLSAQVGLQGDFSKWNFTAAKFRDDVRLAKQAKKEIKPQPVENAYAWDAIQKAPPYPIREYKYGNSGYGSGSSQGASSSMGGDFTYQYEHRGGYYPYGP